ncbi:NfeD family protein [Calothrix sp. 336/3]|uniref:NfeD family protein n=1 Tax=Calothrix sp. 336/3 TaxID=1337936 RepID=UPI0004E430EA|nr:NfeD family protein [Calothrix sp. 336/3]AKG24370.1 membrane protein implicated in regulation of membrane protease activity [Calothrix sp. 336/3]
MSSAMSIWLIIGTGLCLTELFFPTAFVTLMMGLSAFAVALMSGILGKLWLQVVAWAVISMVLVFMSQRLLPKPRRQKKSPDAVIAETLSEIPPGKPGRVLYEGNSWRARCDDEKLHIAAHELVYVVRREGTTLIIMPQSVLHG